MQIRVEVFAQLLTDKQTNNYENITSLAEVITGKIVRLGNILLLLSYFIIARCSLMPCLYNMRLQKSRAEVTDVQSQMQDAESSNSDAESADIPGTVTSTEGVREQ